MTTASTDKYYYLRDHLGSVRVVFNEQDSTEQVNHYYAGGALMDTSTGSAEQPMKYNGKEQFREWGMDAYDYGARWMLPVTGPLFTQIDPLCEKYYDTSPYSYCKGKSEVVHLLLPFQGDYSFALPPRAMPWAWGSLPLQAVYRIVMRNLN